MGAGSGIRLAGLEKRFGQARAVSPLDLAVEGGERVVLVGPSGCGKTTILRMVAGLEEPTAGEIWIAGRRVDELEPAERDVAMVFQSYALYPHMSVRDNLAFGLRMRRRSKDEIARKVAWAASMLGLEPLLDRLPAQLSGGQKQRVAFGRAVVREPRVFLFDEPLSNLDARLRADMRGEIAALHERLGTTMLYVTHDQVEAMTLGHRIAVMREGVLQQYAPPLEVYREPANLFVAGFLGTPAINAIAGEVQVEGGDCRFEAAGLRVPLAGPFPAGPATLGVRPEAVALRDPAAAEPGGRGVVRRLEPLGSELLAHLDGPGGAPWIARLAPETSLRPGQAVALELDPSRLHLFGPDGTRLPPA